MYESQELIDDGDNIVQREEPIQRAVSHFKEAIQLGNTPAKVRLALLYFQGKGVQKDLSQAYRLFQSAAEDEDPEGLYYSSLSLMNGWGVQMDNARGWKMMFHASDVGSNLAKEFLKNQKRNSNVKYT
jgi:uncharacterized protein